MRINLAKVVPFLFLVGVFLLWAAAQNTGTDESPDDGYDYGYDTPDTGRADAYFDAVAVQLAEPGVYVDPAVTSISVADAARLDALAARTAGPVRVLVVPADALRERDPSDPEAAYGNDISYADDELPGQLYDRVGVDGTYAVLVDATSSYDGRSFTAYQFSEERPFYEVETALDRAVDCCAPDYVSMLETFLDHAGEEQANPWPIVGWLVGGIGLVVALIIGGSRWQRHRRLRTEDAQVADALRPSLQEEVVELSRTVAALPPAPPGGGAGDELNNRTRQVLDLVEEARHRLDVSDGQARMDTPDEVEDVVRRLADARYELVAIDALRRGQPVPEKTAPCFFDPRHGPSVAERPFTPEFGLERQVPVCAKCAADVDAGREPPARTFSLDGVVKPYWQWDRYTRPYVNGYWQRHTFADAGVQRIRFTPSPAVSRPDKPAWSGIQFVWENDGGSGGSGGSGSGGGGRRFSGSSGSRSSFGGGSSSRSTRRSGGSRRF